LLFSSSVFFIFFAIYFLLHAILPSRWTLSLIIFGSLIFYGYWNLYYIWFPFLITYLVYFGSIWMMSTLDQSQKKKRFIVVLLVTLIPLLIVKYTNFLYYNIFGFFFEKNLKLIDWQLPLGISFITFTLIAYLVDVYTGRHPLERNAKTLFGLILFFPHLIAGPILRPADLLPQLNRPKRKLGVGYIFAITIFSIGLLKKLVFADSLSEIVEPVFQVHSVKLTSLEYILAIYAFAIQIYCDFSGYTDMAIGLAITLGIKLPINFQQPYGATSLIDFWRRWHITLSNWLRDYVYIPLGGNRVGHMTQALNLFITMVLGGLWHGASWNFVIWGAAHGIGIGLVHSIRRFNSLKWLGLLPKFLKVFITFHFVAICWILFRSPDLATAWHVTSGPFLSNTKDSLGFLIQYKFQITLMCIFLFFHRWDNHQIVHSATKRAPRILIWISIFLIWIVAITISEGNSSKFIYFDF
jgi:alginate O-acetyltransferase complex protein AlgI